jgi:hypothetical protein
MALTGYYKTLIRPRQHRPLSMLKYDPVGEFLPERPISTTIAMVGGREREREVGEEGRCEEKRKRNICEKRRNERIKIRRYNKRRLRKFGRGERRDKGRERDMLNRARGKTVEEADQEGNERGGIEGAHIHTERDGTAILNKTRKERRSKNDG